MLEGSERPEALETLRLVCLQFGVTGELRERAGEVRVCVGAAAEREQAFSQLLVDVPVDLTFRFQLRGERLLVQ